MVLVLVLVLYVHVQQRAVGSLHRSLANRHSLLPPK